ncbi:MAG: hypothetical protein P8H03_00125 [Emcibacteraceae bacterium]|nr:hypothetical protein [Emcibacteraceae bacterium]MDG1996534.1 hypothetical protein [Emcibacteraceae bacterium]
MKKLLVCLAATLFISPAAYALQSAADVAAGIGNNSADKPPVEVRKDANESATNETLRAQDGDDLKLRKRPGRAMLEDDNTTGSNRATDYNSSRSNKSLGAVSLDEDDDGDGLADTAKIRSNVAPPF